MTNTTARIKIKGKNFEILVDDNKALAYKKQGGNLGEILAFNEIFTDVKKGFKASEKDLRECFDTVDIFQISDKIIKQGEILLSEEHRGKERETKINQIIEFLSKNAVDPQTNSPHTPERIKSALEEAGVNIDNQPIEKQIGKILEKLKTILPIKIETKKLLIKIPTAYTGKVYGLINEYKESEEWQNDGSLNCTINLPVGLQMDFYDKLNGITHGSAVVEEVE